MDWLEKIVAENFRDTDNKWGRWKVKYKADHTLKVVGWGEKIIKKIGEIDWNKRQAIIICFLHDAGAFLKLNKTVTRI